MISHQHVYFEVLILSDLYNAPFKRIHHCVNARKSYSECFVWSQCYKNMKQYMNVTRVVLSPFLWSKQISLRRIGLQMNAEAVPFCVWAWHQQYHEKVTLSFHSSLASPVRTGGTQFSHHYIDKCHNQTPNCARPSAGALMTRLFVYFALWRFWIRFRW